MEGIAVHGAAAELRKAIWNLFSNAIAATPRGGTIRVYLNPAADRVRFVVEDNGRGITKADLSRVFQPYFTTKDRGTGIGLTITHRIVTEHGGTIQVESPPPDSDKGTRVTIDLPGESSTHSESAQPNESRG
jgi:signal transduction histidine kinase